MFRHQLRDDFFTILQSRLKRAVALLQFSFVASIFRLERLRAVLEEFSLPLIEHRRVELQLLADRAYRFPLHKVSLQNRDLLCSAEVSSLASCHHIRASISGARILGISNYGKFRFQLRQDS